MGGAFAEFPEALQERCASFVQVQAWPLLNELDWNGWLMNFSPSELPFARTLLEAFVYFREPQAHALLRAAFHSISRELEAAWDDPTVARAAWSNFRDRVIVSYVEGEQPSPTDSGLGFARRARIILGIPEGRIVRPDELVRVLQRDPTTPALFLDDFLGSGEQLRTTWGRQYGGIRLRDLTLGNPIWYVPLLATEYGIQRVSPLVPGVRIRPAHVLTSRYSAYAEDSEIWRAGELEVGKQFVADASARAGYPEPACWGFHRLALCVALLDTIPDASLPLFYSERNGWRPLVRRR